MMRIAVRSLAPLLVLCFVISSRGQTIAGGDVVLLSFSNDASSNGGCVSMKVKNISSKAISAYSITVLEHKGDGGTAHSTYFVDFLAQHISFVENNMSASGWLEPGQENIVAVVCRVDGPAASAQSLAGVANIVIFADGKCVGHDYAKRQEIYVERRLEVESERRVEAILDRRLNESAKTSQQHFTDVANDISQLIEEGDRQQQSGNATFSTGILRRDLQDTRNALRRDADFNELTKLRANLASRIATYELQGNSTEQE
jgi:hypothetical protein